MRRTIATAVFVVLVLGLDYIASTTTKAQSGSCAACMPSRKNVNYDVPNNLDVCFQEFQGQGFPPGAIESMKSGMNTWWDMLSQNGKNVSVFYDQKTDPDTCADNGQTLRVTMKPGSSFDHPDEDFAEGLGFRSDGNATITFNLDLFNRPVDWTEVGAHELGHVLDFGHTPDDPACQGQSVMWRFAMPMPGGDRCADRTAVSLKYRTDSVEEDIESGPKGEDDCADYYLVRYYFWTDGNGWHGAGYMSYYLGNYCGPPPF